MSISFENSNTKINLMKAFAGESQAEIATRLQHLKQKRKALPLLKNYSLLQQIKKKSMLNFFIKNLLPCMEKQYISNLIIL